MLNVAADLLANDSDPNGDPLSLDGFTQPANGTLVDNGDGTLTYTPNAGFTGPTASPTPITDGRLTDRAQASPSTVTTRCVPCRPTQDDTLAAS